jgi:DNA-binding HxlR family transcriptional regulator
MRFSELFEEVGRPSRSHFSQELHNLQREGLVTREELDRKYVEYSLDRRAYHLKLMNEQLKLNEKLQKAQM